MSGSWGGSKSGSKSRSWTEDFTPSEYIRLRGTVSSGLNDIISSGGGAKWNKPFVAEITQAELDQLDYLQDLQLPSDNEEAANQLIGDTIAGAYLTPDANPFLRDYVRAAQGQVTEAFDEEAQLRRAMFARAGHRLPESSPFAHAQATASGEYAEALGDVATNMYAPAYQFERGKQMEAIEMQRVLKAQSWAIAVQNLEAQALPRMIEQMGIDMALEEFYRRQQLLAQALGIAADLSAPTLGGFSWGRGTSMSVGSGGGANMSTSTTG